MIYSYIEKHAQFLNPNSLTIVCCAILVRSHRLFKEESSKVRAERKKTHR